MENELPEGWVVKTLKEVSGKITDGSHNPPKAQDEGFPMLSARNIQNGSIDFNGSRFVSKDSFDLEYKRANVEPGDILLTIVGTIGRCAIVDIKHGLFTLQRSVALIKPNIGSRYLCYYFQSPDFQRQLEVNARGTAQKGIYLQVLNNLPVPLSPLAEQNRIIAKLDVAFGHLETLKTSLARIPELLKKFRQTVLTQAVTGKLTIADINKWEETTLADIIESKPKNGYSANPVSYETPFKVLTLTATTSGKFSPNHYKYFDEAISNESHFWLQPDDIIIQRGNTIDYVGVSAIYDKSPKEFIYPDLMIKVRANKSIILTKYLYFVLSCSQSRSYLRERATGTTGNMPKINQPTLIGLPVHLPSLEEQQEIVNRVEALFATADALEAQYQSLKAKIDKLPQALLAKAFRGELVPQDPTDEPASVLLEKIKAATATVGKKGRKSGQTALAFMEE